VQTLANPPSIVQAQHTQVPLNILDFNNRILAAHNRTEWMTKTFLDRITLTMQFFKVSN
jgi:hypothetical protein